MPENMPGKGIGHFFGAMRIDAFRPAADFKFNMDQWIRRFKTAQTAEGFSNVIIPGEPETAIEKDYRQNGIPLLQPVVEDLQTIAQQFAVSL
jgi:LDH2 family malate/lactate/ureidoglycolate dehydrogenase